MEDRCDDLISRICKLVDTTYLDISTYSELNCLVRSCLRILSNVFLDFCRVVVGGLSNYRSDLKCVHINAALKN